MENIIPLWHIVPKEMLPYPPHSVLHHRVPRLRNRDEDVLEVRDVPLGDENCKRLPVQDIKERGDEVVRDDHGHAPVEDGLDDPRAIDLVPFWTYTVLAVLHVPSIVLPYGARYLHVRVLVLPVFEEEGTDGPVHFAREEGEGGPVGGGPAPDHPHRVLRRSDVRFGEGDVLAECEPLFDVGVA